MLTVKGKAYFCFVTAVFSIVLATVYSWHETASAAASIKAQMSGDPERAATAITANRVSVYSWIYGTAITLCCLVWFDSLYQAVIRTLKKSGTATALLLITLAGCGPFKQEVFEEIEPHETAFVIPLEGDTAGDQEQLQSVEFLEKNKVAAKRISLPQRQVNTGRLWCDYAWKPTVRVVKVNRSPVTREWVHASTEGKGDRGDKRAQALAVESLDAINFEVGMTTTCSVSEKNAAVFLYRFANRELAEVVDNHVRGFVQTVLAREFGLLNFEDCPDKKTEIIQKCFKEAQEFFEQKGVTIEYMGNSDGLLYDPKIQDVINKKYIAANEIDIAKQEKLSQDQRNTILVEKAKAERAAAEELAKATEAIQMKVELEVKKIQAEAMKEAASKWSGNVPTQILPQGSNFLFGLDAPKK